jgi:hypothetical protein
LLDNNEGNDKMREIVECWMKCIVGLKAREGMKDKLSNLTISGKIIKKNKQILFYSVVDNTTGVDLEPFEARKKLEEIGLKFVPIRSLGMFSQQENMVNSLTKTIKSIRA